MANDISFEGARKLTEFSIENYTLTVEGEGVWVNIKFTRISFFYVYTMFIPSLCITICAELTLFVSQVPYGFKS